MVEDLEQTVTAMHVKGWQTYKDMLKCWLGHSILENIPDSTGLGVIERIIGGNSWNAASCGGGIGLSRNIW